MNNSWVIKEKSFFPIMTFTMIVSILVSVTFAVVSIHFWDAAAPPPATMQEVNGKALVYGDGIHHLLNATLLYGGEPHLELTTFVNYSDRSIFMDNVQNLAPGLGWYAHSLGYSHIFVVMPASELALIESLVVDPEGWVKRSAHADLPTRPPSSINDLINVGIKINTVNGPRQTFYWLSILSMVLMFPCVAAAVISGIGIGQEIYSMKKDN